jgi:hypothetical protein
MPSAGEKTADALESSDEEEALGGPELEARLRDLHMNPANARWVGKSSGAKLVLSALVLKNGLAGTTPGAADDTLLSTIDAARMRRPEYWEVHEVRCIVPLWSRAEGRSQWEMSECPTLPCHFSSGPGIPATSHLTGHTTGFRSHLGTHTHAPMTFELPPQDLLLTLVDAYFSRVNLITPLLHRPTFERTLAEGTHRSDTGFCAVLLLVCANGARFVDDRRVLIDGASTHSAGWKWFSQTQRLRRSLITLPCIHDLQLCCVGFLFLQCA